MWYQPGKYAITSYCNLNDHKEVVKIEEQLDLKGCVIGEDYPLYVKSTDERLDYLDSKGNKVTVFGGFVISPVDKVNLKGKDGHVYHMDKWFKVLLDLSLNEITIGHIKLKRV